MKLKLYHAAAAAAIALSVMLLTACGSPKQADPLPLSLIHISSRSWMPSARKWPP